MIDIPLILASSSPRRAQLLKADGYRFTVINPPDPEPKSLGPGLSPARQAEAISYHKACSVARLLESGLVLSGDTIATLDGEIFGKPADRQEARRILQALTGTTHQVITGVTLLDVKSGKHRTSHDITHVLMKPMRGEDLENYLDSKAWVGKAGAYGIQDHGDAFVERIEGSFSNVVGFPMELIRTLLQDWFPENLQS